MASNSPWTAFELISIIIETPSFIFLLSIFLFLVIKMMRKTVPFNTGFYVLFGVICFTSLLSYGYRLILEKLPKYFPYFYIDNIKIITYIISSYHYTIIITGICHVLIALNRCSALFLMQNHNKLWESRYLLIILLITFSLPFPFCAWYISNLHQGLIVVKNSSLNNNDTHSNLSNMKTSFGPDTAEFWGVFLGPIISTLTTILTLFFGLMAVVKLRQIKKKTNVKKASHNDVRLLIYSLFMTCVWIISTLYQLWFVYAITSGDTTLMVNLQQNARWLSVFDSLCSPVSLLILSKTFRQHYMELYQIKQLILIISFKKHTNTVFVMPSTNTNIVTKNQLDPELVKTWYELPTNDQICIKRGLIWAKDQIEEQHPTEAMETIENYCPSAADATKKLYQGLREYVKKFKSWSKSFLKDMPESIRVPMEKISKRSYWFSISKDKDHQDEYMYHIFDTLEEILNTPEEDREVLAKKHAFLAPFVAGNLHSDSIKIVQAIKKIARKETVGNLIEFANALKNWLKVTKIKLMGYFESRTRPENNLPDYIDRIFTEEMGRIYEIVYVKYAEPFSVFLAHDISTEAESNEDFE